jgi:threonine dehydrogenase-like Zn-dependent dehydrogenase
VRKHRREQGVQQSQELLTQERNNESSVLAWCYGCPGRNRTHRLPIDQAPHAYEIFKQKEDYCIKVVLKPGETAVA